MRQKLIAFLVAALLGSPSILGSAPTDSRCSMKLFHVTVVGGEAEREEFRFLLERELNAQGVAFTDDPNKADGTIRGTIRVTSALPMWAFATATVRGKDGKVLWRDYFKSNQLEGVAEQAAKAIFGQCQKGWPQ